MHQSSSILVKNKANGYIYETDIDGNATNLITNKSGKIEKGANTYTIPLALNDMHSRNKHLSKLINLLGLAIDE